MIPHSCKLEDLLRYLGSDSEKGLDSAQVQRLLKEHGENRLKEGRKRTNLQKFIEQFKDVMIIILLIAAVISFAIAIVEGHTSEFFEPVLILMIVILNAFMGVLQENKAEKALEALKSLSAPHARVIRDGREQIIDAAGLVPGDIILLEAGDFVPADARLIKSVNLKSEESALTGESVPTEKNAGETPAENAPLGDRHNMVYSGCSITYGRGIAVVTATGMNTEMGRIADLLESEEDTKTPLQERLARLGKYLGVIALLACAVIFVIGILSGMRAMEIFMVAVSLAVSAIPEGLPAIVTVALAIGVQRMYKRNALIRKLPAVETLGSTTVICSDKTGTLTQNKMTVKKIYIDEKYIDAHENKFPSNDIIRLLFTASSVCSDAFYEEKFMSKPEESGDPTEIAILKAAWGTGIKKPELNKEYRRIHEIPFDSNRKRMTVVARRKNGEIYVFVKGAVEVILDLCTKYYSSGGEKNITYSDRQNILSANENMASSALRVIGVAYKKFNGVFDNNSIEKNLTFIGMVGMIDPPRPEAAKSVEKCIMAGIRPVMITGDYKDTAVAIARDLGMMENENAVLTGTQLDMIGDDELKEKVGEISVYARVSPEHKVRIVDALKKNNHIAAMTGDGVNDSPALKKAKSTPANDWGVASSTVYSWPSTSILRLAERAEARSFNPAKGKRRSTRTSIMVCPTIPVAPTTATLYFFDIL